MILRTPRSTLFPYTTLFRSEVEPVHDLAPIRPRVATEARCTLRVDQTTAGNHIFIERRGGVIVKQVGEDRKSTRLNSSHLGISYAVFCLKKKNKQNQTYNN